MIRVGLDVMGGDHAPEAIIKGAILAQCEMPADSQLVLIGDESKIQAVCKQQNCDPSLFQIVHTDEIIEMGDNPVKAFNQKPKSSIAVAYHLLTSGKIDGFASAGNTGAMLIGAMYTVKAVEGVQRPAIITTVPQISGKEKVLLDVGLNTDCKPDVLYEYGILGKLYAECMHSINNPGIALLNIGAEEEKGNLAAKSAYQIMKNSKDFRFVGNIEPNDLFTRDDIDVIVCDGFVGNVILKEAEAFYHLIRKRNINDTFFEGFNFENYGGMPVLGINKTVFIGHGISNDKAIKNMVLRTDKMIRSNLVGQIIKAFSK